MLLEWRLRGPRLDGELYRVFPGPGVPQQWPLPRRGGGGPLLLSNVLKRYRRPAFKAASIRYVPHHSARHSVMSALQAEGVEVGLVAKPVGHANPAVTLGHDTQAVRGGAEASAVLDRAIRGPGMIEAAETMTRECLGFRPTLRAVRYRLIELRSGEAFELGADDVLRGVGVELCIVDWAVAIDGAFENARWRVEVNEPA